MSFNQKIVMIVLVIISVITSISFAFYFKFKSEKMRQQSQKRQTQKQKTLTKEELIKEFTTPANESKKIEFTDQQKEFIKDIPGPLTTTTDPAKQKAIDDFTKVLK